LLRRCLEGDRRHRLQAIAEVRIAIDAPEEVVAAPVPSRSWGPIAVAALALAGAIIAAIGWWRAARLIQPNAAAPDPPGRRPRERGVAWLLQRSRCHSFARRHTTGVRVAVQAAR
jgi:hypothetical protein